MKSLRSSIGHIPSNDNHLNNIARSLLPEQGQYKKLCQVDQLMLRLSNVQRDERDTYSLTRKLKKLHPVQRVKDMDLFRAMMIEDLEMEQKIKKLSKYVLKETFDFGLKNFYSKITESVKNRLISKGIKPQENLQLAHQKKQSTLRKTHMVQCYHQLRKPKLLQSFRTKRFKTQENGSPSNRLNIHYEKHRIITNKKKKLRKIQAPSTVDINSYFY